MQTKSSDRAVRNLGALQRTASTSRVLNLIAIEAQHGREPEYRLRPFFQNRVLNGTVLLKHRLRADERELMGGRPTATKVILPFVRSELQLGGRSVFVGQSGWMEMIAEVCSAGSDASRDMGVLQALDELPSLDPFLMREHLKRRGFDIARCYFAISESDLAKMQAFVSREINKLIALAFDDGGDGAANTAKLVELLLSAENDERLEPLRLTLRLEGEAYREGVFSWRGFLYYKWVLSQLWPKLEEVIAEAPQLKVVGPRDVEMMRTFTEGRARLQSRIEAQRRAVLKTLQVYDEAFKGLTVNHDPLVFRDFLLKAPQMFITLGDKIGVISHIATFWRYRFPAGKPLKLDLPEAVDIVQEFEAGLAEPQVA